VKDTVGAGDSFAASFLLGVLRGESHDKILHAACEIAAAACSHAGAVPKNCADNSMR
jgi:sugar/nucleoside kinase (ribokinase family)